MILPIVGVGALLWYLSLKKNGGNDPFVDAFLDTIKYAEGTFGQSDPYRVTFGYGHTITNLSDHPTNTGEWMGKTLPANYCAAAGLSAGCKSTAAGAYQIIRPTWNQIKNNYPGTILFDKTGQDIGAMALIASAGALDDVESGDFDQAIYKINDIWASLPGSPYGQPTRSINELRTFYTNRLNVYA